MNRRAVTPIIEHFFIFAMGVFLFSMVVTAFRELQADYLEKTGDFSLRLAGEYASLSVMNLYELKSVGKNATIETTAVMPRTAGTSGYYVEIRDSNITVRSETKTETLRVPARMTASGSAQTLGAIRFSYDGNKINLNGRGFD